MPARFRKTDRIVRQADFDRLHGSELFAADHVLVIKAVGNQSGRNRLGLSVSRRVGNAVVRNRWKRLIREAFRLQVEQLPVGWDLMVRPRRGARPNAVAIASSLVTLVRRIDKYSSRQTGPKHQSATDDSSLTSHSVNRSDRQAGC